MIYPILETGFGWKDLKGIYLRGIMEASDYLMMDDDIALFLFIKSGGADRTLYAYARNQDYHCYDNWEIEVDDRDIPRGDRYKAIGDFITDVMINDGIDSDDGDDVEWQIKLVTPQKIISFDIDRTDSYYPTAL